jgi:hypothetical protein
VELWRRRSGARAVRGQLTRREEAGRLQLRRKERDLGGAQGRDGVCCSEDGGKTTAPRTGRGGGAEEVKGKCALGPFLSILVIECQHKCLSVNLCQLMDKVQIKRKGMFLRLSTLFWRLMYCV